MGPAIHANQGGRRFDAAFRGRSRSRDRRWRLGLQQTPGQQRMAGGRHGSSGTGGHQHRRGCRQRSGAVGSFSRTHHPDWRRTALCNQRGPHRRGRHRHAGSGKGVNGTSAAAHASGQAASLFRYPDAVAEACLLLASSWWRQRDAAPFSAAVEHQTSESAGVDRAVQRLLEPFLRRTAALGV